ncbi:rubrerythrin family protein [Aminipila sp.]|uniref:rubrerythrin family protein n=1 Tax=Aminipila sp. TaxID=2060095 RepID=UPI00289EFE4F|nr:ferritin family protein [Aminipila sp.]
MDFKQSKTYQNLKNAYDGERKASTKYAIYGSKAREDGYEQIGNIFDETSSNEREHAEIWLKQLNGGEIPSTLDNLKESITGENYEWTTMYREFAETARKEGFNQIAELFDGVASIEYNHDNRFKQLIYNIENDQVFCKEQSMVWVCLNCGNLYWDECAPEFCPVCGYPQAFYQLNCNNY